MIQIQTLGKFLDLDKSEGFSYTLQVQDFKNITTVSGSYSASMKVYKTPDVIEAFKGLGIVGHQSDVPYSRVYCNVLDDGVIVVERGLLKILGTYPTHFKIAITSGVDDFFSLIKDLKFYDDIPLPEIVHFKTDSVIIQSQLEDLPFTYLFGNFTDDNPEGVPADASVAEMFVDVPYLIDKIKEYTAFEFTGSIFSDENYLKGMVNIPQLKGLPIDSSLGFYRAEQEVYVGDVVNVPSTQWDYYINNFSPYIPENTLEPSEVSNGFTSVPPFFELFRNVSGVAKEFNTQIELEYTILEDYIYLGNRYRVRVPLKLRLFKEPQNDYDEILDTEVIPYQNSINTVKANVQLSNGGILYGLFQSYPREWRAYNVLEVIHAEGTDLISDVILYGSLTDVTSPFLREFEVQVNSVLADENTRSTRKDVGVAWFMKEFMTRFGLTAMPDKNKVVFYKIDEITSKENAIDITDDIIFEEEETYLLSEYAMNNFYAHKYVESDSEDQNVLQWVGHADGVIRVNNQTLAANKTIFQSSFFAPKTYENQLIEPDDFLSTPFPIFVYDEEKETYERKERLFWVRKEQRMGVTVTYKSVAITNPKYASAIDTTFSALVAKYIKSYEAVLTDAKINKFQVDISPVSLLRFDFTKTYYCKQKSYFMKINKLTYKEKELSKIEFLKI